MPRVRTVVVRSATPQLADGRVSDAHGQAGEDDDDVEDRPALGEIVSRGGRDRRRCEQQPRLDGKRRSRPRTSRTGAHRGRHPPGEKGADREGGERRPGSGDRQSRHARRREAEKHDVPRHVRREDVSKSEKARGVDHAGHHREREKDSRQGATGRRGHDSSSRGSSSWRQTDAMPSSERDLVHQGVIRRPMPQGACAVARPAGRSGNGAGVDVAAARA